jgi:poly-beta-1,6-N-acetyl-D-glucosamine synthase
MTLPSYVVVTPVRDEERFIAGTVESMLLQTHKPRCWVIVNDGSTDRTRDILVERTAGIDWIRILDTGSMRRDLGTAEVVAFSRGMEAVPASDYDFVVKLDADVRFDAEYFARLLGRMSQDSSWGIASGMYWEEHGGEWRPIRMPGYHAAGACKVVRRACFEQIGGFVASKGWDTLDEIRAGMRGWRTGHFPDIRFDHLKPEGSAMGSVATHRFHGLIYYRTGGGTLLLIAKALHRMITARPRIRGGLALASGYFGALLRGEERLVTAQEKRYYRQMLNRRIRSSLGRLLMRAPAPERMTV